MIFGLIRFKLPIFKFVRSPFIHFIFSFWNIRTHTELIYSTIQYICAVLTNNGICTVHHSVLIAIYTRICTLRVWAHHCQGYQLQNFVVSFFKFSYKVFMQFSSWTPPHTPLPVNPKVLFAHTL